MANDHYHPHDYRRGSSVTNNSPHDQDDDYGHGHGRYSSNKHARKHRKPNPPPVPQPVPGTMQAQQRVPTSHLASHAWAVSDAPMPASAQPAPALTVDPEAMPAKQGLNEWGAFTGGAPSGSGTASGTFGFGPLLFHAGGEQAGECDDIESSPESVARSGKSARVMSVFEMDRLLYNDPISFNPLHAITWAKLEDDPLCDRGPDSAVEGGRENSSCGEPSPPAERGDLVSGKARGGKKRKQNVGQHINEQTSPASKTAEPQIKTSVSHTVACGPDHREASSSTSPVGTMSKTLSTVSLQMPRMTDGRSKTMPPPARRVSASHPSPTAGPSQQLHAPKQYGQRQQRKHRQRNGIKTSPPLAPSPIRSEIYPQHQVYQPPLALPPSAVPISMLPQPAFPLVQQACPYGPAPYTAADGLPHPIPQQQDLFLCLGPYCSARFPTEAELSAHYRAEHSLACSWATCGAGGFTSNNALVWHVKAEHLLLCPVPGCCDRVFTNKKALDGHVRVS